MPRLVSLFNVQPIIEQLASGQLIITPNQRLASRIQAAYAIHCGQNQHKVIHSPRVYSLASWVEHCWQRLLITANPLALSVKPLSTIQEQLMWEDIVQTSTLGAALLRPSATAQQAMAAYKSLVEWRLFDRIYPQPDSELQPLFQNNEDCAVFLEWLIQFDTRCQQQSLLSSAQRIERVIKAYQQCDLTAEGQLLAIGFDDISPLHQLLLTSCGKLSCYQDNHSAGSVSVVECDTESQELIAAAVWAKQLLKNDANCTVAIVIPNLSQQRAKVQRVLLEVFDPDFNTPFQYVNNEPVLTARRNLPFNLSAGYSLLEAPIIAAAMDSLLLCLQSIDRDAIHRICHSPFYCLTEKDTNAVQQLLQLVYRQQNLNLGSTQFRQLTTKVAQAQGEEGWHFADVLQQQAVLARAEMSKIRPIEQWAAIIQALLVNVGWPGSRPLDSIEYQQVSQWKKLLESFQSLDHVCEPMGFTAAINQLRGLLSRHIFQPQTTDSSLQILGTLEAAGLQFDHMWLQSMSAKQWPASPAPNPLLPVLLQRQHQMPHACAERELDYAKQLSQRFIHSAKQLIVSAAKTIDDSPSAVSKIFIDYPKKSINDLLGRSLDSLLPLTEIRRRYIDQKKLEKFEPGLAPVLAAEEKVKGGSGIFSSQSACPFRAFVSHRLQIKALPNAEIGLTAAERGSLLHRALELLWKKLKTQQTLLAMDESTLEQLCWDISQFSVIEIAQRKKSMMGERFQQLEKKRLTSLLLEWLELEKQRSNFVVKSHEDRLAFSYKNLHIEMRMDRIDQLDDGSQVIIDYKTGICDVKQWFKDRPDAPQLPLYSMLAQQKNEDVSAIAFAQVQKSNSKFMGVGSEHIAEPLVRWQESFVSDAGAVDWDQLKGQWEKVLSSLADDFINGKAEVDPKYGSSSSSKTCRYCDLASVCRVRHQERV